MWKDNAAGERSGAPRLPKAVVAGLGALAAAALFLGAFNGGPPPKPARAEAVVAGGGGPARPSTPRLCFQGSGGEILDFAPRQHCP